MGRFNSGECKEQHTPISPEKNRIRLSWLTKVGRNKDIITISHGLLDMAMANSLLRGWKGRLLICDIDEKVREATNYLRLPCVGRQQKPAGNYPMLNILPPGKSIESTILNYCEEFGAKNLGAVDIDLACSVMNTRLILQSVLSTLSIYGYRGKVFLTFSSSRDKSFGQGAKEARIAWLNSVLSSRVKILSTESYASVRLNEKAKRSKGSSMCFVTMKMS